MKEVNPKETTRAYAFEFWMRAPMPMVTFFKTIDVSRRTGLKFNMLMCYCIGRAASGVKEFYMLPVGEKLIEYDSLAVNTIVANKNGEVSSCDVPFSDDMRTFNDNYLKLTRQVAESCENHDLTESMVIGTSAIVSSERQRWQSMRSMEPSECTAAYSTTRSSSGESTEATGSERL